MLDRDAPPASPHARERILEAGYRVISAKSYNGCGLNEILAEAGVPKGSFYHYFKSKEDFGVALIEREATEHGEHMREILSDRTRTPLQRVVASFEYGREFHRDLGANRECLIAKLALELSQLSAPMRAAVRFAFDHWTAILAQTLREGQAKGEIRADLEAEVLAGFLVDAWGGCVVRMQIEQSLRPIDVFIDRMLPTLLAPCPPSPLRATGGDLLVCGEETLLAARAKADDPAAAPPQSPPGPKKKTS